MYVAFSIDELISNYFLTEILICSHLLWPLLEACIVFTCNANKFATASVLYLFFFSTTFLDGLAVVKIPFGQKRQNMFKNDLKTGFSQKKFCHWFLLEVYLNKNLYCFLFYCTNYISGEIPALQLQLERLSTIKIVWFFEHISPDGMTGSHCFCARKQIARR